MNKEKKSESLAYLLEAASKIFGEKKLLEMLVSEGAPKDKNLEEIVKIHSNTMLLSFFVRLVP